MQQEVGYLRAKSLNCDAEWLNFDTGAYFSGIQADLDGVQINVHYAFGMVVVMLKKSVLRILPPIASTASSPWRSKTAPSATRLLVNAARMETMRYLWMSSCSLSYGACLLIDQKLPRVRVIRTRDQKVSQLRNSSYTGQWQDGGST
ncbi:hypothetical protein P3L10_019734 [Capsicum annuum]